jgi:hypothetical protein
MLTLLSNMRDPLRVVATGIAELRKEIGNAVCEGVQSLIVGPAHDNVHDTRCDSRTGALPVIYGCDHRSAAPHPPAACLTPRPRVPRIPRPAMRGERQYLGTATSIAPRQES